MQLQLATWPEVEACLEAPCGIIVPTGSAEHRGPMRLIGTDGLTVKFIGQSLGEKLVTAAVKDLSQT